MANVALAVWFLLFGLSALVKTIPQMDLILAVLAFIVGILLLAGR